MINALKAICLALYLVAIVATILPFPAGLTTILQYVALLLLGGHALEVVFALRRVRRYPGSLVDSIALTLLFGFLHWRPLARR
jgi:uncharacterized protein YhhL (DUF1145 family)